MDNQNNNTVTEPFEKLALKLTDYENFVENDGRKYTDCFECEFHAECGNYTEY